MIIILVPELMASWDAGILAIQKYCHKQMSVFQNFCSSKAEDLVNVYPICPHIFPYL